MTNKEKQLMIKKLILGAWLYALLGLIYIGVIK